MRNESIAVPSSLSVQREIVEPFIREEIEAPVLVGDKVVRIKRYKDDVMKEFRKSVGLGIPVNDYLK